MGYSQLNHLQGSRHFRVRLRRLAHALWTRACQTVPLLDRVRIAHRRNNLFRSLVQDVPDGLIVHDRSGRIRFVNPAFEHLLGIAADRLIGTTGLNLIHPDDAASAAAYFRLLRESSGLHGPATFGVRHRDGTWHHLELVSNSMGSGEDEYWVVTSTHDVTKHYLIEEQLSFQALHDVLTGLPNRILFQDRLSHAIASATRRAGPVAVLFVDLDDFKVVNDHHGHQIGDQVLVGVARQIEACLRPGDTATRWGGDEFTILLDNLTQGGDATFIATRIANRLGSIRVSEDLDVNVTASIGIAVSHALLNDPDELMRCADAAMYEAKQRGKARIAVFAPSVPARRAQKSRG